MLRVRLVDRLPSLVGVTVLLPLLIATPAHAPLTGSR